MSANWSATVLAMDSVLFVLGRRSPAGLPTLFTAGGLFQNCCPRSSSNSVREPGKPGPTRASRENSATMRATTNQRDNIAERAQAQGSEAAPPGRTCMPYRGLIGIVITAALVAPVSAQA